MTHNAMNTSGSMRRSVNKNSAVAEMGDRLAIIDIQTEKLVSTVPFCVGGAGSPSNTMSPHRMWPGPRPTSVPSGILIHPTVWPQYTNVTDRQNNGPVA